MKKISVWMLALMLMLSLCSCAVMSNYTGSPTASASPASAEAQQTPEPAVTQEPTAAQTATAAPEPVRAEKILYGNSSGNLLGGHMARGEDDDVLYVARLDGVYALDEDNGWKKLSDDNASDLNMCGGRLIYVARTGDPYSEEGALESLVSIKLDGSERTVLLSNAWVGSKSQYNLEDMTKVSYTSYTGISDLAVWGDYAYYITANGNAGMKDIYNAYEDNTVVTTFEANKSIYRMPIAGGAAEELVSDIGNGDAHLCISDNGQIYYTTCYYSGVFPYPVVTFNRCEADGSAQTLLYGETDTALESAAREIVAGLMVENDTLYVLANDSEGDFPHARIMMLNGDRYDMLSEATYHVNPVNLDDDEGDRDEEGLIWLSHGEDVQYEQNDEGVITGEYLEKAELLWEKMDWVQSDASASECKILYTFEKLNRYGDEFSTFEMAAFDDELYLLTKNAVYCIEIDELQMEKLAEIPAVG